jgi:GNAT superfamily N-acetyltransferase
MTIPGLTFRRFDVVEARKVVDVVEDIYTHAYVELIASGDLGRTPEAFMRRFDAYTRRDDSGFEMVHALIDGAPVGQAWGWPLGAYSGWWCGLRLDAADADLEAFRAEDGGRTFALCELMVRSEYTGRGVARVLHTELLGGRAERRATLLVAPTTRQACATYLRWGWAKVGVLTPNKRNALTFDVLVYDLPPVS